MVTIKNKQLFIGLIITAIVVVLFSIYRKMKTQKINGSTSNANVKAFLQMIRHGEGTLGDKGYRTLFGGELFTDMSKHPNKLVIKGKYKSTAAGAYQFLYRTWLFVKTRVSGLNDFSPENQDKGAIALLEYRGVLEDVKAGNFERAVNGWSKTTGANKEWASLPNSPYGQPMRTMAQVKTYYTNAGGTIA